MQFRWQEICRKRWTKSVCLVIWWSGGCRVTSPYETIGYVSNKYKLWTIIGHCCCHLGCACSRSHRILDRIRSLFFRIHRILHTFLWILLIFPIHSPWRMEATHGFLPQSCVTEQPSRRAAEQGWFWFAFKYYSVCKIFVFKGLTMQSLHSRKMQFNETRPKLSNMFWEPTNTVPLLRNH